MKIISSLVVCLAVFCGGAQAAKILALLKNCNLDLKGTHSINFKRLTDSGQEVTFKFADDPSIVIKKDDKLLYDHLVIFSPAVEELGGSLSVEAIEEFINDGGNVLMAGSSRGGGVITDHESLRVLDELTGCSFSYSHNPEDPITEYPNVNGKNAPSIIIAHFQRCIAVNVGSLSLMYMYMTPDTGLAPLALSLLNVVSNRLFFNFLRNTSDIPVPHLVLLGAILIISGFLLGPSSPLPFQKSLATLIIGISLLGAGVGASGAAVMSAERSFVSDYSGPWYQDVKFLCSFDICYCAVIVVLAAINIDRGIHLHIGMEVVLLALIFLI